MKDVEYIAKAAHQINKAYCESIGDLSQVDWEDAPEWQRISATNGVIFHITNSNVTPEESHENWLAEKIDDGWSYGSVKNVEKKTHPCMLPYVELPKTQRTKDYLFKATVEVLK